MRYGVNYKIDVDYRIPTTFEYWIQASRFIEYLVMGADKKIGLEIEAVPKYPEKEEPEPDDTDEEDDEDE